MKNQEALVKQLMGIMEQEGMDEQLKKVETLEDLRALLRAKGIEADDETLDGLIAVMADAGSMRELDEKEMEEVSGGLFGILGDVAKTTWNVGTWVASKVLGKSHQETQNMVLNFWGWRR